MTKETLVIGIGKVCEKDNTTRPIASIPIVRKDNFDFMLPIINAIIDEFKNKENVCAINIATDAQWVRI